MNLRNTHLVLFVLAAALMSVGCTAKESSRIGFISDYSNLEPVNKTSMRYLASGEEFSQYTSFIIEPVEIHFHAQAEGIKESRDDAQSLAIYMRGALVDAIADEYSVVSSPGPGVARVRIALTDIKKSSPALNTIPQSKLIGMGLGGAAMEGEIVDSQSGIQLAALIESKLGERLSLDGLSEWGDAKAVIDGWAKRLRERLDEAHGK